MAKKKQNHQKKKSPQAPNTAANKAAQRAAAREERKRQKRSKIIRVSVIAAVTAAAVGALSYAGYRLVQESGVLMQTRVAAETDHYKVTNAMYCYFYDQCYNSYLSYFEDPADIEFDTSKKLRDQEASEGTTWHDFFVENTNVVVETMLQYCETAYRADFTLTDEQIAECAEKAAKLDRSKMPAGVREEDMQKAMELELLAGTYYNQFVDAISITDEDVNSYYEKNKAKYLTWDMLCYTIAYDDSSANSSNTVLTKDEAASYAQELSGVSGQDGFKKYVRDFLINVKQKTEQDADNMVNAMKLSTNGSSYSAAVSDWVLEESPAIGDTFIYQEEGQTSYQVYMLISEPVRNESDAVDFRTLVLFNANHDGEDGAMKQAERLMDELEENGADETAFSKLAMSNSEDSKTFQTGGLVTAYAADRTTYGTKIVEWLFDESRKPGDRTIISDPGLSSGVVMLAYYVQDNPKTVWENQVYDDIYAAELAVLEDEKKLYRVSFDEEHIDKLDY